MKKTIGIDIGGTKIAAGIVYEDGKIEHEVVIRSNVETRDGMFDSLLEAIDQVIEKSGLLPEEISFGIGVPGLVDSEAGVAIFQNNLPWENFPLKEKLMIAYPSCQSVAINNDVYQAALAEWYSNDVSENDTLVFFTISTGVSTAIVKSGEFLKGAGFAGEVGLLPIEKDDEGNWLRLESLTSGNALADIARTKYNDGMVDGEELFDLYRSQDPIAVEIIETWSERIAYGLYTTQTMIDPNLIILGGSVIQKNPDVLSLIKEKLEKFLIDVQKDRLDKIVVTQLNNQAGLLGAGFSGIYQGRK